MACSEFSGDRHLINFDVNNEVNSLRGEQLCHRVSAVVRLDPQGILEWRPKKVSISRALRLHI